MFIKKAIDLYEKFLKILTNPMKKLTFGWRYRREAGNKKSIKSRNLVVLEPLQNIMLLKKVCSIQSVVLLHYQSHFRIKCLFVE